MRVRTCVFECTYVCVPVKDTSRQIIQDMGLAQKNWKAIFSIPEFLFRNTRFIYCQRFAVQEFDVIKIDISIASLSAFSLEDDLGTTNEVNR